MGRPTRRRPLRPIRLRAQLGLCGTQARHKGRIQAGGVEKDVAFVEEAAPDINDQIDVVYRTKYLRYAASIIRSIVSPEARCATIKLVPRSTSS
jgi:hypothetical protein